MSSFAPASKKAKTTGKKGLDSDHFQGKTCKIYQEHKFGHHGTLSKQWENNNIFFFYMHNFDLNSDKV